MNQPIKLVCAGFGGQGVLTIGQLIAMMAMEDDYLVSWMPSYGPEMRGGTANCHVVISKDQQQSPIIANDITHLLALNQPAFNKFAPKIGTGGTAIVHQALVKDESNHAIGLDFTKIAQQVGNDKAANMAAFGALVKNMPLFSKEQGVNMIKKKFSHLSQSDLQSNCDAFELGYDQASINN